MLERLNLLRSRSEGRARVGYAELLFDLVFVYAVTQLSHFLLAHLTPLGIAETALLLMAVWWVWIYTAWVTNWLDPERPAVQLMLFVLMGFGLVLAISLPGAFGSGGLAFAAAYAVMQVGRSAFMWWVLRRTSPVNAMNFARISVWLILSSGFWIAGGSSQGGVARILFWALALLLEYGSPLVAFRVPGLGRSQTSTYDLETTHMAERCALFIIIALGESILATGATFARRPNDAAAVATFIVAFVVTVAMWWLYFARSSDRAGASFAAAADVGAMARSAYTYFHLPVVAGIIVFAAGAEEMIAHPLGRLRPVTATLIAGGPLLYLLGLLGFRHATRVEGSIPYLAGSAVLLLALFGAPARITPLALGATVSACLFGVILWETRFAGAAGTDVKSPDRSQPLS